MGVTDEDSQMDLDFYIGNFDLKSIFFPQNQIGEHITSAKSLSILISPIVTLVLDFMESQKKCNTKLT